MSPATNGSDPGAGASTNADFRVSPTRGDTHEQHVKAGEQSHKKTSGSSQGVAREREKSGEESSKGSGGGSRGGTHEQHVKAGQQSHKNS
jgi:uncharacterized protein